MNKKQPDFNKTFSWERQEWINGSDAEILKQHGLDTSLWRHIGHLLLDDEEAERQIEYLRKHKKDIPRTTLNRCATQIMGAYVASKAPPPQSLLFLVSELLESTKHQFKYAKKNKSLEIARSFCRKNPGAKDAEIARVADVNRSTVGSWRRGGKLTTT